MAPDTPESVPGNGQYFFLTRVLPHAEPLSLEIEWPQNNTTDLPGFYYPGNVNFAKVLAEVCFSSRDRETWERITEVEPTSIGVRVRLQPNAEPLYFSIGVPYMAERLERLIGMAEGSEYCQVEKIGKSRNGRPLFGLLFEPSPGRPCQGLFLLQGYQHHSEWAGLYVLDTLVRGLVSGAIDGSGFAWAIVPCLNADALYGGWREDLMHTHSGNGKCGNLNRDWSEFEYPETRAASGFYRRLAKRWPVAHGIDIHMGWSSPVQSGGALTVFKKDLLPEKMALQEAAFTQSFFKQVPIEPVAWEVTEPERTNFSSWIWREFRAIAQTMEVSRFKAFDQAGRSGAVCQAYYESLGRYLANSLVRFYAGEDKGVQTASRRP
jgi:hypothetical protein